MQNYDLFLKEQYIRVEKVEENEIKAPSETRFCLAAFIVHPTIAILPIACKLEGGCVSIAKERLVTIG